MVFWKIVLFGIVGLYYGAGLDLHTNTTRSLVRLWPANGKQTEVLRQVQDSGGEFDVFKKCYGVNDSLDIFVNSDRQAIIEEFARSHKIKFDVKPNYDTVLEESYIKLYSRAYTGFNIYGYNTYKEIQTQLEDIAARRPDIVTLETLGKSYEGRTMKLVKISSNPSAKNPIIFIDAGIHAREWVAPAMAMYIIHRLTSMEASSSELSGVDWYILPMVNPDGYEFTWSSKANRLWRKTRSKTSVPNCMGVDGNRNYGFKWGLTGVSADPCHRETYAGPEPFSEVETRMVRNVMLQYAERIKLYVSLHSYGQYIVYPWGYTGQRLPVEWRRLDSLARKVSGAIVRVGGQPFKVLSAGKWYPASGGSDDYAFGMVKIPYSYTMELTDGYSFQFPETKLKSVLPQFYEGFRTFGYEIKREYSNKAY